MEPEWTKKFVPDWLICDWFYFFFLVNLVLVVVYIVAMVGISVSKMGSGIRFATLFGASLSVLLGLTNTLFFYLMCDRTLKPTK